MRIDRNEEEEWLHGPCYGYWDLQGRLKHEEECPQEHIISRY